MTWDDFRSNFKEFFTTRWCLIWLAEIVGVLGFFLAFVIGGWPGQINNCIWGDGTRQTLTAPSAHATAAQKTAYNKLISQLQAQVTSGQAPKGVALNSCYCENFSVSDVVLNKGGARQPTNTWFNLYSIGTSLIVALWVFADRKAGVTKFIGSAHSVLPHLYIFAVLFLGLGSMWFHGSLKEWGGVGDGLSMYTFVAFLVFYTIRRGICDKGWVFWLGYIATVVVFTATGEIWSELSPSTSSNVSLVLILLVVGTYAFCELIWISAIRGGGCAWLVSWRWWCGIACIGVATLFWSLSKTGKPLCSPTSFWQPHGLLWHPLAGGAAVFIYFYWRLDTNDAYQDKSS